MLIRFTATGHAFMLYYVAASLSYALDVAGILTLVQLWHWARPRLAVRHVPVRLVAVTLSQPARRHLRLLGVRRVGTGTARGRRQRDQPGHGVLELDAGARRAAAQRRARCASRPRRRRRASPTTRSSAFVHRSLGRAATPNVISDNQAIFAFNAWRDWLMPDRVAASGLTRWDYRHGLLAHAGPHAPTRPRWPPGWRTCSSARSTCWSCGCRRVGRRRRPGPFADLSTSTRGLRRAAVPGLAADRTTSWSPGSAAERLRRADRSGSLGVRRRGPVLAEMLLDELLALVDLVLELVAGLARRSGRRPSAQGRLRPGRRAPRPGPWPSRPAPWPRPRMPIAVPSRSVGARAVPGRSSRGRRYSGQARTCSCRAASATEPLIEG